MRIGIVTTWFERGAAYVSKQYLNALKDKHEVFIYARGGEEYAKGDSAWDQNNVYWGKKYPMPVDRTYIDEDDFINWLDTYRIDTVLFNEQRWWQPVKVCKEKGVKVGSYIDYYTDTILPLFGLYDFLICNTQRHYSAFSWHKQCYYIPWGTDINVFKPNPESFEGKMNGGIVFFHSAGMSPFRKGTDFLIRAFKRLSDQYDNCKLIIHIQVDIVSFFPELANVIDELIQGNKLEIIEKTVGAPGLYHLGDVYVYPSRIEGIGLTIVEALSSGLPVVTVDNGPMNEFISSPSLLADVKKFYCRTDGYYWPVCEVNIESLIKQMSFYIINHSKIREFKKETRLNAIKNYNWDNNANRIQEIFESAKVQEVDNELLKKANAFDTGKFPYILKYPKLYSLLYRNLKKVKEKSL